MRIIFFISVFLMFCLPCMAQAKPALTMHIPEYFIKTPDTGMLSEDAQEKFSHLKTDPDPVELVRNSHYWISNENAHYVWYEHVKDLGGVISGVGTDQIYLIAGWMNASMIIPMDFDRAITHLHFAYGAAFMSSENIDDFLSFWKKGAETKMRMALEKYFPEHVESAMKAWKSGQTSVNARLNKIMRKYTGASSDARTPAVGIPTFVSDETQYMRIRQLWLNHRVYPTCGDLTGSISMRSIAEALEQTGRKMRVIYTSNAGQYFTYSPDFVQNFVQMPFEENALILRTRQLSKLGVAEPGDYHYNMQNARNFQRWLKSGKIAEMPLMLRKRVKTKTTGLSVILEEPEGSNP